MPGVALEVGTCIRIVDDGLSWRQDSVHKNHYSKHHCYQPHSIGLSDACGAIYSL